MTEINNHKFIKLYCATYYKPSSYIPPVDYYFASKDELDELDEFAEHYTNHEHFKVYEVVALNIDNVIYPLGKPLLLHRTSPMH